MRGIKVSGPLTLSRILDKLISDFIEPECIQPTFLFNHPLALSPLAKDAIDPNVSIRKKKEKGKEKCLNFVFVLGTNSCC